MARWTTGGLTLLRLVPDQVIPASGRQLGFWGGDAAAADRAERVLARVQGLLGPEHVVTPVPQGGRTPAERVRWVPWGEPREPAPHAPIGPVAGSGRGGGPARGRVRCPVRRRRGCSRRRWPRRSSTAAGRPVTVSASR